MYLFTPYRWGNKSYHDDQKIVCVANLIEDLAPSKCSTDGSYDNMYYLTNLQNYDSLLAFMNSCLLLIYFSYSLNKKDPPEINLFRDPSVETVRTSVYKGGLKRGDRR